jgi:hypothetical protein
VSRRVEGVAWATLLVLATASLYELLVALEVISLGDVPGEDAPGARVVLAAALLAMLVGAGVGVAHALESRCERRVVWAALAPASFVFVVARLYSFDPYYLPTLRRYAEGGVSSTWIAVVGLASIAAALVTLRFPRGGSIWTSVVLVVAALTAWILPFGK